MNRDEALANVKSVMDTAMESIGRGTTDISTGYKPALDSAFRQYITRYGLTTGLDDTDTDPAHDYCFLALLEAVTYDMIVPGLAATQVDFSVDAPLTSVKFSQAFRAMKDARNWAWWRASACGWGLESNVNAFRVSLAFNEPTTENNREY